MKHGPTDEDRQYASELLADLANGGLPRLEIAARWFCKARLENHLVQDTIKLELTKIGEGQMSGDDHFIRPDNNSQCRSHPSQWRAFHNGAYPNLWGVETIDPAALEAGLEIVVAPCMPERAARDLADAWNRLEEIKCLASNGLRAPISPTSDGPLRPGR